MQAHHQFFAFARAVDGAKQGNRINGDVWQGTGFELDEVDINTGVGFDRFRAGHIGLKIRNDIYAARLLPVHIEQAFLAVDDLLQAAAFGTDLYGIDGVVEFIPAEEALVTSLEILCQKLKPVVQALGRGNFTCPALGLVQ